MAARWFEIPGIRSWIRGRRKRGETDQTRTNGTSSTNTAGLSEALDQWDRRLAREEKEHRSAEDQRERFSRDARRQLEAVIAPTLERVGMEVRNRGHAWAIEERIDIQAQPAVACTFRPSTVRRNGNHPSELCFRFHFPDRLAVTGAVATPDGLRDLPARSYAIAELDDGLVRREVTRLITAALDAE